MSKFAKQWLYAVGFIVYCIVAAATVVADGGQYP